MEMDKQWVAHVKIGDGMCEVSVCYGVPAPSWGWFGAEKMRLEGGTMEDQKARAEKIAAALNAANFIPYPTLNVCAHGYTICAPCKFPSAPTS
jgi:hypothetical protein